jgi:Protein of unknown function (DUF1064)
MATRGWTGVTLRDLAGLGARPARTKYGNVRCLIDGLVFDSRAEGELWLELRARERAGEIFDLRRQVAFPLYTSDRRTTDGPLLQVAEYVADFVYYDRTLAGGGAQRHVVDVKSPATRTAVYRLKCRWLALQEGITIEEIER